MALLLDTRAELDSNRGEKGHNSDPYSSSPDLIQIFCFNSNCVFGWISYEWWWKMLLFGLLIGLVCMTGFNYAIQHIPALVFSSATLVDPLVTGFLSYMAGLEAIPDVGTWLGGFVTIAGVAVISYGESRRSGSGAGSVTGASVSTGKGDKVGAREGRSAVGNDDHGEEDEEFGLLIGDDDSEHIFYSNDDDDEEGEMVEGERKGHNYDRSDSPTSISDYIRHIKAHLHTYKQK